ncbi:MAG: DUF1583 domain-containing protein [Planctomycetaceae bacterium]|nr:DUF1583 domain-containing protein [Planctomycetaceae bacterium]
MPELSRRAVRESVMGGFPVADPTPGNTNSSGSVVVRSTTNENSVDPIETEVVRALREVSQLWTGEDYPPKETYELQKQLVLPPNRPEEIRMYIESSNMPAAAAESLADALVQAASDSGQLDDLRASVEQRSDKAAPGVAARAMFVLIAVKAEQDDAAQSHLESLSADFAKGMSSTDQQASFLAALRAMTRTELRPSSMRILREVLNRQLQSSTASGNETPVSSRLSTLVNEWLVQNGDVNSVREYFDSVLTSRQTHYSRYSGNYGLYLQKRELAELASQAAHLRLPEVALDYIGRSLDFDAADYGSVSVAQPFAAVIQANRLRTPDERYSAWHNWTMPQEGRLMIRAVYETHADTVIPPALRSSKSDSESARGSQTDSPNRLHSQDIIMSNIAELVQAAEDTGQLQKLREELEPLVASKMQSADTLLALVLIAQEDESAATDLVRSLQSTFADRMKSDDHNSGGSRERPSAMGDYLIYQACLKSPMFVGLYADRLPAFRKQLQDSSQHQLLTQVNRDWAARAGVPVIPDSFRPGSQFAHWIAVNDSETDGSRQPWWAAHEDQIVQIDGKGGSFLYFGCPLTGNFTISADCFEDSWAECDVSFNGVSVLSQQWGSGTTIRTTSSYEEFRRPEAMKRTRPAWNHVTIESCDGQVRFLLNHHLVYQEPVSPTSPWLMLRTEGSRVSTFRNISISGDVSVPAEVRLIADGVMDGWNTSTFGESQPRRRIMKEKPKSDNDIIAYYQRNEPSTCDWTPDGNVLKGKAVATAEPDAQSWICYHRPLRNGESIDYEFMHRPGRSVAHPSIGQVALMLEPDGVRSHWIATSWDKDVHQMEPSHVVTESSIQRSVPPTLPLKENEWNSLSVRLRDNTVIVTLNGTVVCERPLEPYLSRRFGIFRWKNQSAEVRNLVMKGNWPQAVPSSPRDMLSPETPDSPEAMLSVAAITDDRTQATLGSEVVRTARSMSPDEAIDYLTDWVLPSATHTSIRLYSGQVPSDQTAGAFGNVVCPAVELVRLAVAENQIGQLTDFVDQHEPTSDLDQRNLNALRALLALERNSDDAIRPALADVWNVVQKGYPRGTRAVDRQAEYIVAWRAGQHSKYWPAGEDMARKLRDFERSGDTESHDGVFSRRVHVLVGDIRRFAESLPRNDNSITAVASVAPAPKSAAAESAAAESGDRGSQWTAVPYLKPEHRAGGLGVSTWNMTKGRAIHLPGDTWSQLYFQSPLRGKFEIVADRTTHGHKEVSIAWGMHSAEPRYDLKAVRVSKVMHKSNEINKDIPLPAWDQLAEFRIAVDGNKATTFTNGVMIHEHTFAGAPDPWLLIQAHSAANYGAVSNFRILGTPEIPSEIDLLNIDGMASWRADVYSEWFRTEADSDNNPNLPWKRNNDELTGRIAENTASEFRESLILYQRPMLEDGVIEFETWYEPGTFEVHPALGRHAFLLTPEGIRLHQLTNAQYETSDLRSDNQRPISGAADRLELREKDWNRIRLSLTGDQLTISVNDTDVAAVTVEEPENERQFGLFRYSNRTQCRVRKIVYRGDWPKTLPPISEQELTAPGSVCLPGSIVTLDADLSQPADQLQQSAITVFGPKDRRITSPVGLELHMHNSKKWEDNPGISVKRPIEGDCEITVDYTSLNISPQKSGWGVSLVFDMLLDDPQQSRSECNVSLDGNRQLVYKSQLLRNLPGEGHHTVDHQVLHSAAANGSLKLVRQGGEIRCYAAAEDSDSFRLLNSIAVGDAKIREINCGAKASDDVARLDVTLHRLTIRQPKAAEVATAGELSGQSD